MRILLVEDDPMLGNAITASLTDIITPLIGSLLEKGCMHLKPMIFF